MPDIYTFLAQHAITYQRVDHPPVYTVEEADRLVPSLGGVHTKNLFLQDRRGRRFFFLMCASQKTVNLKTLGQALDISKLSLASPERLRQYLGVEPGTVTLLALINDLELRVEVLIDRDLWQAEALTCHPLVNTATLTIPRRLASSISSKRPAIPTD